jgi:DNA-binding MarR family transcriptional regulator
MKQSKLKPSDYSLNLDNQLCFALYAASLHMTKAYTPVLKPFKLTYPQYLVMMVLWQKAPISVSEIGQLLFLDSGTLTPMLKRLETSNYVTRARDPLDERRVLISLTASGKKLRTKISVVPSKMLDLTGYTHDEAMGLKNVLKELYCKLQ